MIVRFARDDEADRRKQALRPWEPDLGSELHFGPAFPARQRTLAVFSGSGT